jgi:hypothetical protein
MSIMTQGNDVDGGILANFGYLKGENDIPE